MVTPYQIFEETVRDHELDMVYTDALSILLNRVALIKYEEGYKKGRLSVEQCLPKFKMDERVFIKTNDGQDYGYITGIALIQHVRVAKDEAAPTWGYSIKFNNNFVQYDGQYIPEQFLQKPDRSINELQTGDTVGSIGESDI